MRQQHGAPHHVTADVLFALAAEELTERDARRVNAHLATCRPCRRLYTGARELQREAVSLGDQAAQGVDELTHRRIWSALAPEAAAAAERVQKRQAWAIVLSSRRLRLAASILLVVGLGVGAWVLFGPRSQPSSEPRVGGASAAASTARDEAFTAPLGPPSTSRLAESLDPRGAPVRAPVRRRRHQHRPDPGMAMDLDLTGPVQPPPAPGSRLKPRPGERALRCGGLLASGGATVKVVRDQPRQALIRLGRGQVGLRVPKLPQGGRLEVVTPDARVRVVGTRFTVRRAARAGTTVTVTEGVVWVLPTGRNRQTVVLRAGASQTVLGEAAYLATLHKQLTTALNAGRLKDAARLGRRYLDVLSKPGRAATMKLRLAGILARLGRTAEAVKLYQDVMGSSSHAVARQNALAFLARLYERLGKRKKALTIWRGLVTKYPKGLFVADALRALVRAECGQQTAPAMRHRQLLQKRAGRHANTRALLKRCRPQAGR